MEHPKHDPIIWNTKEYYDPQNGLLVAQLPRGVTFVYDLYLVHPRDYLKCLTKKHNSERVLNYEFFYNVP